MKKLRLIIILYFVLLGALAAAAKGAVKISGTVTDENNEPMEFVTVKIGKRTLLTYLSRDRHSAYHFLMHRLRRIAPAPD